MKKTTYAVANVVMIGLICGMLVGCTASKAPTPMTVPSPTTVVEVVNPAGEGPVELRIGEKGFFPPAPPEGIVGIAVEAIVTEPRAVYAAPAERRRPEGLVMTDPPTPKSLEPRPTARVGSDPIVGALGEDKGFTVDPPAPAAPPFSTAFDSLDFDGNIPNTGGRIFIPPDPSGAAGPDHVVSVVNVSIQFHTKAGTPLLDSVAGAPVTGISLASFFAPLSPVNPTFDPKVIYDQHAGRFLVVTLERQDLLLGDPVDSSRILLAVSDDSDPNGTWYMTSIPSTLTFFNSSLGATVSHWADYPGFAVDEEAVYITNNMFSFFSTGGVFGGTRLWIVDKLAGAGGGFYGGGTPTVSLFDPVPEDGFAGTTQPAHVFGAAPGIVGTWLTLFNGLTGGGAELLQVVRVDDPLGVGTTTFFGPSFVSMGNIDDLTAALPDAPQSGTGELIETNDRRTLHSVWRDNQLYVTTTIDPEVGDPNDGQATAHWVRLDTTVLDSPALADQGDVGGEDIASGAYTFFPSVAVSSAGDVAVGFSASASSIFPSSAYTTRSATDPPGSNSGSVILRAGLDYYIRTFDAAPCQASPAQNRWGDYTGAALDPVDECFWVYNQHAMLRGTGTAGGCNGRPAVEDGRWGTAFGRACICSESFSLTQGEWKQISLACNPGAANTVADVFGDDLSGTYDVDWVVYRHDEATQANVKLMLTDTLAVGESYWIKTRLAAQTVVTQGIDNVVTDTPLVGVLAAPPAGCASSAGRCNKVGHPHKFDVCWADVLVDDGGVLKNLATVDPAGICQTTGGVTCVMSRIAHKWNGSAHEPFDGQTLGMEGTLVPWDGFWVSANKPGIELRIPATAGNCGAPARNVGPSGWYIRLIAESGNLRDASNVLGQLSDSVLGYDAHDLEELSPFGSPFLTVVFPHDDWGEKSGAYSSDYHSPRPEGISDGWRFEVRSSEVGATVTLRWEGPDLRLLGSVLLDEETGQQVAVDPDGSYSFTLSGTSRSFQWTLPGSSDLIFADGFESGDTSKW